MAPRGYNKTLLADKKEIIQKIILLKEKGVKWNEIARQLNISRQLLQSWYKNRDKILQHLSLNPESRATVSSRIKRFTGALPGFL